MAKFYHTKTKRSSKNKKIAVKQNNSTSVPAHFIGGVIKKYRVEKYMRLNPLKPNEPYSGRTAPLTSKRHILYIYSTNIGTDYFKHVIYSPNFFYLFKMQLVSQF